MFENEIRRAMGSRMTISLIVSGLICLVLTLITGVPFIFIGWLMGAIPVWIFQRKLRSQR